jgi:uncharacterized membrane protein HdeD (DUF308 family)
VSDEPDRSTRTPLPDGGALRRRIARLWWVGAGRGVIALLLGLSMVFASGSPNRIATYLAIYWLSGGLLTLRFAWAIRPQKGFRLAALAGWIAVVASGFVLLRVALSNVFEPTTVVDVLGYGAIAIGALRLVGAFALEQRTGRRWTLGGLVLGGLEIGVGILLVAVDVSSPAVATTIAAWAFASGTILLIEALRVRAAGRTLTAEP